MLTSRSSRASFAALIFAVASFAVVPTGPVSAQGREAKPVPKNSVRVAVPGCSRGSSFLAGAPAEDQPGGSTVPEGARLRMNGPKALMNEIKGQEGSRIEITGLMRKGQDYPGGIALGGGVRVGGGSGPAAPMGSGVGSAAPAPGGGQLMIDVEGWRRLPGVCQR